ncbi:MAG: hypothetical protein JJ934_02505 [Pseudomonadales bacterium]|nr:hypothetical protein [Pseudomonadales bacterium]MBO6566035.1 hypothetical protein [Pseudomonadales bacterium]MBO6595666.1 hypothetical protein [Pseudomonadales bacterium]MBO6655735.1 hypothetical protein [Pseudomonadales bacterium]MBO6702166.1 hypothetical protein [Pseudomonadales bacterium]
MSRIVILGASSGPGRLLFEQLRDSGTPVIGLARSRRDVSLSGQAEFIEVDAEQLSQLQTFIDADDTLVHCSSPELLTNYLKTEPQLKRLIAIGSTRIYTRFPDNKCNRLADMAHVIWMGNIPTTLIHPTMIYGAPGLNNIERVIRIARLSPFIPLPENGRSLIQPILAADLVKAILACLSDLSTIGKTIAVPGKEAVTYRRFVELCIEHSGSRCRVLSVPYFLIALLAPFTHILPGVPNITQDEVRRLLEDKNFETEDLESLGVEPTSIEDGLERALEG